MAQQMNRAEMIEWLNQNDIVFPRNASVSRLRQMMENAEQERLVIDNNPIADLNENRHENHDQNNENGNGNADADGANGNIDGIGNGIQQAPVIIDDEEARLDAEIRLMRKRQLLAELKRELAETENVPMMRSKFDFNDIQHSVVPFSGNDCYDANKWISDFERACAPYELDENTLLKTVRRLMKRDTDAELFLHIDTSVTYGQFRTNFLNNFGHEYSISEIIDKLKKTTFNSSKTSIMGYILKMQEIASRTNIAELQVVQFIIDGFRDRSANIAVLHAAQNIAQLKTLSHRYAQLRELFPANNSFKDSVKAATTSQQTKPTTRINSEIQCYNCSGYGHLSSSCMKPKRAKGSCFRCGAIDHMLKDCPKPAPANNRVALVTHDGFSDDEVHNAMNELNMVSVTFLFGDIIYATANDLFSLFDTGSPISLIKRSSVPQNLITKAIQYSGFRGVGNFKLRSYGKIPVKISFREISHQIDLHVVPDTVMSHSLLLGRDFLKKFNIRLSFLNKNSGPKFDVNLNTESKQIKINQVELHCIYDLTKEPGYGSEISEDSHIQLIGKNNPNLDDELNLSDTIDHWQKRLYAIEIENECSQPYDINPELKPLVRDEIMKIIKENYELRENIPRIDHDYEMKIRLSSDIPISHHPRRLSYTENQEAQRIVRELLQNGTIRPSDSPYSCPIVLPGKKSGEKRLCGDFRSINKIMDRDSYPLPIIDDCIERMEGKKYFTLMDLKSSFHQVKMSPDSIRYTSFVVPIRISQNAIRIEKLICGIPTIH